MKSYVPDFEMVTPTSFSQALKLLKVGGWQAFAGGTDLMVQFEAGTLKAGRFLNLARIDELKGIREDKDQIVIGALTTYTEIRQSELLRKEFPLLQQAARDTGAIAIQNRGTVGGNIANASPAADTPPALLVYEAQIELVSDSGSRRLPYERFHLGYKKTQLGADEVIAGLRLPRGQTPNRKQYYRKVGTRSAQAISKVCLAGILSEESGKISAVRIAVGSVAPVPLRCLETEKVLLGRVRDLATLQRAQRELSREIAPVNDIRSTSDYRRQVTLNLLEEFLAD